jgi:hypothetical protein
VPDGEQALTGINLKDLPSAFGLRDTGIAVRIARRLMLHPAWLFARLMLEFDAATWVHGIDRSARQTERLLVRDVRVYGGENIPIGGMLALSNHPGLTDTLALFSALSCTDLRTIALERSFPKSLSHLSRHLFFLHDDMGKRAGFIREVSRFLRGGGAVLTFPAGQIEPDPEVYPGAVESLAGWTDSAAVFLRLAPDITIVPICVRGVTWQAVARHPVTRLRRLPADRQLLASALQLLWQLWFKIRPITVRIQIGRPTLRYRRR